MVGDEEYHLHHVFYLHQKANKFPITFISTLVSFLSFTFLCFFCLCFKEDNSSSFVFSLIFVMKCPTMTSGFEPSPSKDMPAAEEEEDDWRSSSSTTTSSSIGRNSDADVSGRSSDGDDENEVQSSYNGGLSMMDSLQRVLPMRRGISSFYNGKSRSFTTLADASTASTIKDIAKPENAYTRRRRNLLAINHIWDKNRNNKRPIRPISSSKSTLALAVAMSSSESMSSISEDSTSTSSPRLPPLYPQTRSSCNNNNTTPSSPPCRNLSNWRSFSLADVREYGTVIGSTNPHCASFHNENQLLRKGL
ncbi:hypothetical protein CXB51_014588 [Gossypium anomalum]|uniref:Uncharacterized protein n=1 Tax=Gossypium anomalum TaxID=47600 RepID=A0A8J5Z595_9ROSI|nr:hypothetical protein CXB51_014588 [Gossypium anomalum]